MKRMTGLACGLLASVTVLGSSLLFAQEDNPFDTQDEAEDTHEPEQLFLADASSPSTAKPSTELPSYRHPISHYPFVKNNGDLLARVRDLPLPKGYERVAGLPGFSSWVQELPLFPKGTPVTNPYGSEVLSPPAEVLAVTTVPVLSNACQCADMAILLWAYYHQSIGQEKTLRFKSVSGDWMDYSAYRTGTRYHPTEDGRHLKSYSTRDSRSDAGFQGFLKTVFLYAGSASLSRDLPRLDPRFVQAGDLFVQPPARGGQTGHVSVVVDTARNAQGQRLYRMAYGYIPAMSLFLVSPEAGQGHDGWFTQEGFAEHVRAFGPGVWRRFSK